MPTTDFAHILIYGPNGSGKSMLAGQAEMPQLIHLFDSLGNARKPYFENMRVVRGEDYSIVDGKATIIPQFDCYAKEDEAKENLLRRILFFGAGDPNNPLGVKQFKTKLPTLISDATTIAAKTYIFDSFTPFTAQARHAISEWRNVAVDEIAREVTNYFEDICMAISSLEIATIAISHITTRGDTKMVRDRDKMKAVRIRVEDITTAPGRMADRIFGYFSDVWCTFIDEEGRYRVMLQGNSDHIAKNTFNASAICDSSWNEITKNKPEIIWE